MPSAAVLADEGVQAVKAGRYDEGIQKLTEALKERPAPLWLLERSKAYLRTKDFELAMWDAEKALRVAFDRANRDQMIEAQTRRAITFFRMEQYADADICAAWAMKLCDGGRATEDDGQQGKVDSNGDYVVTAKEVEEENKPADKDQQSILAQATGGNSKTKSMRNQAFTWRVQALTQMGNLEAGAKGRKVTITTKYPTPSKEPPAKKTAAQKAEDQAKTTAVTSSASATAQSTSSGPTTGKGGWENMWNQFRAFHSKKDIRSSFYQTDKTLNVDIFVKNVDKDALQVNTTAQSVTLEPVPGVGKVHLLLNDKINTSDVKVNVKSMKIELVLKKEMPAKWPILRKKNAELFDNLAFGNNATVNQFQNVLTEEGFKEPEDAVPGWSSAPAEQWYEVLLEKLQQAVLKTVDSSAAQTTSTTSSTGPTLTSTPASSASKPAATAAEKGPAYPTSSKRGPTNWDSIGNEDAEEKSEDVNSFFQQIYKNADEDTKRAMMKSYVESNGTSLSTSWDDAKNKQYETAPPDGAEAKKW